MKTNRPIQWLLSLLLVLGVVGNGLASSSHRHARADAAATIEAAVDEYCEESTDEGLAEPLPEVFSPYVAHGSSMPSADSCALEGVAPYAAILRVAPRPSGWRLPLRI